MMEEQALGNWNQFSALLKTKCTAQSPQVALGLDLLHDVLKEVFGCPDVSKLTLQMQDAALFVHINQSVQNCVAKRPWKRSTAQRALSILRRCLRITRVLPALIECFTLQAPAPLQDCAIGKRCASTSRALLQSWVDTIKKTTRIRSCGTLQNMMLFYRNQLFRACNIRLEKFDADHALHAITELVDSPQRLAKLCENPNTAQKKLYWVQVFLGKILGSSVLVPLHLLQPRPKTHEDLLKEMDGDKHRISKQDLETMYKHASRNVENELMFLMLLTTGMRIGGYARMKITHVARIEDGYYKSNAVGSTIEKGPKVFRFQIHKRVQELLEIWLNKMRGFSCSEYVFPSRLTGTCTAPCVFSARFKNMCKKAGLQGPQFHAHALRHCYTQILCDLGNSSQTVARLINHTCVKTTEQYYLKRNVDEVYSNAVIPWMESIPKRDPVPDFLAKLTLAQPQREQHEANCKKAKTLCAKLDAFLEVK
jgi:integrase